MHRRMHLGAMLGSDSRTIAWWCVVVVLASVLHHGGVIASRFLELKSLDRVQYEAYLSVNTHKDSVLLFFQWLVLAIAPRVASDRSSERRRFIGGRLRLALVGGVVGGLIATVYLYYTFLRSFAPRDARISYENPHVDAAQLVASEDGIWRHSFLSCCALPLEIVAYPVACGIFLGLDKPRAVLGISFLVAAARVGGTMLAAHGGLLGSAVADLVAAFAGTVAVLIYLRSSALVAQYPELWECSIKSRVAWDFIRDAFFLVLRGFVLGLCSLAEIDFVMDATHASFSFVLDTLRAMYLPSMVFALPVGYAALIFGGKYLSQVFLIHNPADFFKLASRLPWIAAAVAMAAGVAMKPLTATIVTQLDHVDAATANGLEQWWPLVLGTQCLLAAAQGFECVLASCFHYAYLLASAMVASVAFSGLAVAARTRDSVPLLLVAPALGYFIRVFLAALRLHYQVLRELKQEGSLPGHRRSRGHRKRRFRDGRRGTEHSRGFLRAFITGEASPRTDALVGDMGIDDFSDLYEDVEGGGADPLLRPDDSDEDSEAGAYAYAADEEAAAKEAERARELARERRRQRKEEHDQRRRQRERQRARAERAAPRPSDARDRDLAAWGSDVEDAPLSGGDEPAPLPSPGSSTCFPGRRGTQAQHRGDRGDDTMSVSSMGSFASRSTGRSSTRRQGMSRHSRQRRVRTRESAARSTGTASFMQESVDVASQGRASNAGSGRGSVGSEAQSASRGGADGDSTGPPDDAAAPSREKKKKKKKKRERARGEAQTEGLQDQALAAEQLAAAALKTAGDMAEGREDDDDVDIGASE